MDSTRLRLLGLRPIPPAHRTGEDCFHPDCRNATAYYDRVAKQDICPTHAAKRSLNEARLVATRNETKRVLAVARREVERTPSGLGRPALEQTVASLESAVASTEAAIVALRAAPSGPSI